ncbi:MAG: hypothetical protein H6824_21625 [Planctomycetaceae bacterium]|nr:hypothetical protein [Planctomycetaceae bacterium]
MTLSSQPPRSTNDWEPFVVGAFVLIVLLATSFQLPLTWDEPNAILRSESLQDWASSWLLRTADTPAPWTNEGVQKGCPYTTQIEGHPTGYGLLIALGRSLTSQFLPAKESNRFGPMGLFAVACSAVYVRLRRSHDKGTALSAIAFLLLMPRLFAHAHFATTDGPLMSAWIILWASFDWALVSWRRLTVWGMWLGYVMSCKFTGWIAVIPFLAWSTVQRDTKMFLKVLLGTYVGFWMFVLLNPTLWHDLPGGIVRFFELAFSRRELGPNVPTMFLGQVYDLHHPLPWYNTTLWILFTVPPATLIFAGIGFISDLKQPNMRSGLVLILINWLVLVVVRALPWAPPHDAIRLWLPSFPFLAVLAGIGFSASLSWAKVGCLPRWSPLRRALAVAILGCGLVNMILCNPQWLSYYSPLIGGVVGAERVGLEPTYYWDGFDSDVHNWLDDHCQPRDQVYCHVSNEYCDFWNRTNVKNYKLQCNNPEQCNWILVQNRTGHMTSVDKYLTANLSPAFVKRFSGGAFDRVFSSEKVPIAWVYSREQYLSAQLHAVEHLSIQRDSEQNATGANVNREHYR